MSQGLLDFGHDNRVSEAQRAVLRTVNDAVDAISLIVAAGACGCRTQDLSDSLAGRSNRYLRIEWILSIAAVSPPDFQARIANALVNWLGYKVESLRPRTDAEKLSLLEQRVAARFGAAGLELVEESRK